MRMYNLYHTVINTLIVTMQYLHLAYICKM